MSPPEPHGRSAAARYVDQLVRRGAAEVEQPRRGRKVDDDGQPPDVDAARVHPHGGGLRHSPVRGPTFRFVAAAAIAVAVAGLKAAGSGLSVNVPTSCRHVRQEPRRWSMSMMRTTCVLSSSHSAPGTPPGASASDRRTGRARAPRLRGSVTKGPEMNSATGGEGSGGGKQARHGSSRGRRQDEPVGRLTHRLP